MRLTFAGFVLQYCRELSGLDTTSVRKLCAAAAGDAPRTAEPLFLHALGASRLELLLGCCSGTWMEDGFSSLARLAEPYAGDALRFVEEADVPSRYTSVLDAYRSRLARTETDRRVIALMRGQTLEALGEGDITIYRLCTDLGLNKGNVYAYLNAGDVTKVSRDTARRILERARS